MRQKSIEEVLQQEGMYVSTTSGYSMYPMLRDRQDTIVILPCKDRLKKYDVPLYKSGNRYVLHRIIEVKPDSYVIRGDNCDYTEYGITDEQILGVLAEFRRGDRRVSLNSKAYKCYVFIWCHTYHIRCFIKKIHRKLKSLLKRIIRKGEE